MPDKITCDRCHAKHDEGNAHQCREAMLVEVERLRAESGRAVHCLVSEIRDIARRCGPARPPSDIQAALYGIAQKHETWAKSEAAEAAGEH